MRAILLIVLRDYQRAWDGVYLEGSVEDVDNRSGKADITDSDTAVQESLSKEQFQELRSWYTFIPFCLNNLLSGAFLMGFEPMLDVLPTFYNMPTFAIQISSLLTAITCTLLVIPACYIQFAFGIRSAMVVGSFSNVLAAAMLYPSSFRNGFPWLLCSEVAQGIGLAFVFPLAPAVGFEHKRRALMTTVAVASSLVGAAVGWMLQRTMVYDSLHARVQVSNFALVTLSYSVFVCFLTLLGLSSKAALPANSKESYFVIDRQFFISTHQKVSKSTRLQFIVHSYAIYFALFMSCRSVVFKEMMTEFVGLQYRLGELWMKILGIAAGLVAALVLGMLLDAFQRLNYEAVILNAASCAVSLVFLVVYSSLSDSTQDQTQHKFTGLFVTYCLFDFVAVPFICTGVYQITQLVTPGSEAITGAILTFLGSFYYIVTVAVFRTLLLHVDVELVLTVVISLYVISTALAVSEYIVKKKVVI